MDLYYKMGKVHSFHAGIYIASSEFVYIQLHAYFK